MTFLNQLHFALSGILFLVLAAGISLSIFTGVLATRVVVKPFNRLKSRAMKLFARRIERKLEINIGEELEELAVAFNKMGENLFANDIARNNFF